MEEEIRQFFESFMEKVAEYHDYCLEQFNSPVMSRTPETDSECEAVKRVQEEIDLRWRKLSAEYFTEAFTYKKSSYGFVPRFDTQIITDVKPKGPRATRHLVFTQQELNSGGILYLKYELVGTDRINKCWTLGANDKWVTDYV